MKLIFLCLVLILTGWKAEAQHVNAYFRTASYYTVIYTGKEEIKYPLSILNDPYLYTKEYKEGTLLYDGVLYPDVKLRLNGHKEELVVLSPDGRFNIIVPTERVGYATIGDLFIFYNISATGINALPDGYYVRLHNGKYPVLKRETCIIQSKPKETKVEESFVRSNRLYVLKDGKYNQIRNKSNILKLFKSEKKALKRFIKEKELNFKNAPDDFVAAVAKHYETLAP